jgi:hypothetical protein
MRYLRECHPQPAIGTIALLSLVCLGPLASPLPARLQTAPNLDIRLVTDEADAALAILKKLKAGAPVDEADWNRLFTTEGYVRLKKREAEIKRSFEDAEFHDFVLSSELLAKTDTLAETLARWKKADMKAAATRALAYLPAGTAIRVKVYPVIKPKTNSFVFELQTDPAIFLYLNPEVTEAQFENTVAHELHHIGLASACLSAYETDQFKKKPAEVRTVLEWIGAFGEGMAMLAAAGGPDIHPHAVSPQTDRDRWDKDMANFNADLKKVEDFFLDVLGGRLKGEEAVGEVAFSFFGIQGPWYTVGWKMMVTIEKTFGRDKLIDCLCDPVAFLAAYNEAVAKHNAITGESLAIWSPLLLKRLQDSH